MKKNLNENFSHINERYDKLNRKMRWWSERKKNSCEVEFLDYNDIEIPLLKAANIVGGDGSWKERTNRFAYENECKFFIFWLISWFPSPPPFRRHYHLSKANAKKTLSFASRRRRQRCRRVAMIKSWDKNGTMRDVMTRARRKKVGESRSEMN